MPKTKDNSKEEYNKKQRERRKANGNAHTRTYEKTKNGFLMRTYRNMQSRVEGVQHLKAHLYLELSILPREQFYTWAKTNDDFTRLFENWTVSGHDRKLTPSIDRIDSNKGYELENMRWISHSENSKLGAQSRWQS